MKAARRYTAVRRIALIAAMAISSFVTAPHAALAARDGRGHGLETTEHRYFDSAHRLHIDIRIENIPLRLRDGSHHPTARGGGRRSRARASEQVVDVQSAAPAAEAAVPTETAEPTPADAQGGFFTAPGYSPPLPSTAHPLLPMQLAP